MRDAGRPDAGRTDAGPDLIPSPGVRIGTTPVLAWWTGTAQGDLRRLTVGGPPPAPLPPGPPVFAPRQVHGREVLVVDGPVPDGARPFVRSGDGRPADADGVVAVAPTGYLAVISADCGVVALASPQGVRAAVHAGWRGLLAGVVEHAVAVMRDLGAGPVYAGLGPCIHACCYEFSPMGLADIVDRYGASAAGRTTWGTVALDLPAAIGAALERSGAELAACVDTCTGCSSGLFSHRRRQDPQRQALIVWSDR